MEHLDRLRKKKSNVEIRELQCRNYLHVKKSNVGITCMLKKKKNVKSDITKEYLLLQIVLS